MNWIKASKQLWKFYVGCTLLVVSVILFKSGFYYLDKSDNMFIILILGGVLTISFFFIWLIFSLRCQFCKGKIVLAVIKNNNGFTWFTDLLTLEYCPLCKRKILQCKQEKKGAA
jgi:hypothetical protein